MTKTLEFYGGEWNGDVQSVAGMNTPFWVRVTNSFAYGSLTLYSWVEIQWYNDGTYPTYMDQPSPRYGTLTESPFFEPNNCPVPIGSIARIERAYFDQKFLNIYVCSYFKPCTDPEPVPSYWYCMTPPDAQWYCVEPPDVEEIACASCSPDTLPSLFDVQIDDLDDYIPGASASMVVTVEYDSSTQYWTGKTYFNSDRAFVQIRITCGSVPGIFYVYFDVGPFDAFGFSYTGGVDTPTAILVCSPFSYSGTAKILVNNGFSTFDSGFVATLTMPV